MTTDTTQKGSTKSAEEKKRSSQDADIGPMLLPSLYRLTEGIPRKELKVMVSEAKACEDALEKEIKELNEALEAGSKPSAKKSSVDMMLETEVTPPDGYFTVSSLLGRLRDDLATPLPPNSVLPALRAQNGLLQPPQKKKKTSNTSNEPATPIVEISTLEKQKQVLALIENPDYTKEHLTSNSLLALWKKISGHRTSVVFRRPVNPKEAPGYTERILFPMDLSLMRKMIVARTIKSYKDMHVRAALICHNCVKYNGRESDYGLVTRDFEAMVDEFIVAAVAAESTKRGASPTPPVETKSETPPPPTGTSPANADKDKKSEAAKAPVKAATDTKK